MNKLKWGRLQLMLGLDNSARVQQELQQQQ
jgi:hypothetical protein